MPEQLAKARRWPGLQRRAAALVALRPVRERLRHPAHVRGRLGYVLASHRLHPTALPSHTPSAPANTCGCLPCLSGKKLSYIFSFGKDEAADVIWRYSGTRAETQARRDKVHEKWLLDVLAMINQTVRNHARLGRAGVCCTAM
jgi:hypothetical protein